MIRLSFLIILYLGYFSGNAQTSSLPEGFVYIKDIIPDVVLDVRYAGSNNFIGKPIEGYLQPKVIISAPAAKALKKVQEDLKSKGYCLKIFDAYRPQSAVNQFIQWAKNVEDTVMKQQFYPYVDKKNLFSLGYIASRSGHSRGSTVDLTIIDANTGKELDMGGSYDLFDDISHHNSPKITPEQQKNRKILKETMRRSGFIAYPKDGGTIPTNPNLFPIHILIL